MDPVVIGTIGEVIESVVGIVATAGFALVCFPSIRAALVERIRSRGLRHADATDIVAQLNGLRGEVYALRAELADSGQTVGGGGSLHQGLSSGGGS